MISAAEEAKLLALGSGLLPVGTSGYPFGQTFDRRFVNSITFQPTSGTMYLSAIFLPVGAQVTAITFVSGATAESGGTNLWFALYKADLTFMAQSTNDTAAAAFAANTALRKALTAVQTLPYSGLYYVGYCSTNSAGAQPALYNAANTGINANGNITGMTPILAATSTTGLTTTAPSPAGALTTVVNALYAFVD